MKYKLLKPLPWMEIGRIIAEEDIEVFGVKWIKFADKYPDFFEPIVEKKTYDDLKTSDEIFVLTPYWEIKETVFMRDCSRSETFLTREEAEDEHKRREWAVRKDKFVPIKDQRFFSFKWDWSIDILYNYDHVINYLLINSWLAFRTREECQEAIKEHDLIRLFYTIR